MESFTKEVIKGAVLVSATLFGSMGVAQTYPSETITVVSGFPAGGGTDAIARYIAKSVSDKLGQTLVVENRPGAGGGVAATYVSTRPGDGYTILQTISGTLSVEPVFQDLEFTKDDFIIVGGVAQFQEAIVGRADLPWNDLGELLENLESDKSQITFGSQARIDQMVLAQINNAAENDLVMVPFSGGPDLRTSLLGGHIDLGFSGSRHLPMIAEGQMKAIAVIGEERYDSLPETPTLIELGIPFSLNMYSIFAVPGDTPTEIVEHLSDAIVAAAQQNEFKDLVVKLDAIPVALNSAQATDIVERQLKSVMETKTLMGE
ncbi:tripartite tricarboxylate transporter substrate binding protein [Sulfitobacter sp. 20_GPM-1509m]|uniref:Bug family tripartite tricarboxylate transporter substrate binding protein n=1 Tax=Sulfitobacter sp. 20_GPM-1509m TaxID=1380367 RepID=UPI00048DD3AF|nr:tripartite tricarboxylate transporter substrate binding protein [Sulfitobacter sp. 20_GPM-1509m]